MKPASDEVIPGRAAISVGDPGTPTPEGWRRILLTTIARMESGHTPSRQHPEYWDGDVPWVGIVDARLHHGREINATLQTVTEKGLANSAARWLPSGTVCLSRTASIGYVTILGRPMATSQDFVNWVCREALEPKFLMYALLAEGEHIRDFGKGSTHTTIYFPQALAFQLDLAPIAEQRRIVGRVDALLAEVNRAKARLDRVAQMLKHFRQSLLAAACSGRLLQGVVDQDTPLSVKPAAIDSSIDPDGVLPELPSGWQTVALGRLVTSSFYGPRFSSDDYVPDGIPTVRTTDMDFRGRIQLTDSPRVRVSHDEMRRFGLEDGDLLVTRTGSIGKCALYDSSLGPAVPSAYLIRFRLDRDMVLPDFVLLFLMSPFGQRLLGIGQTAVAQPNVNAKAIESFPFPLPPLSEQRRIVAEVERGLVSLATIEKRVRVAAARAEKLPQAILAKAFSGELVPTEAELARAEGRTYESAEDLLRRLSSDREPDSKVVRAKSGRRVKPKN